MKKNIFPFIIFALLLLASCTKNITENPQVLNNKFNANILSSEQLAKILYSTDSNYILIDVRNPHSYKNGHLKNALNIPSKLAYRSEYQDIWKSDKIKIIYGEGPEDALLMGYWANYNKYRNVFVALGGYEYILNNVSENFAIYSKNYGDEKPLYDYAKVMAEVSSSGGSTEQTSTAPSPSIQVPTVSKNEGEVSGGCE